MANSNSGKHARKVTLDAAVSNAIAKAVDARKVAAFTVGAAGVLAGAAFAFGATPAMAAETGAAPDTKPTAVTADENAGANKKADAGKAADGKDTTKSDKAKETETEDAAKQEQTEQTNKQDNDEESNNTVTTDDNGDESTVVKSRSRRDLSDKAPQSDDTASENQDRASNNNAANQDSNKIKPDTSDSANTKIEINENNAETMPNAYAWGSSDNTYSKAGETHTVTFHFDKPKDGSKITSIAIFPSKTNGFNNEKSERGIDFYSKNSGKHQAYSGEYEFTANDDGSADLKMKTLFRDGNLNGGAEKYTASRSIFVYVTNKDGKEDIAYKTNVFRTVTLVPPKTSGSVVLKYNQELTPEKVQAAITEAGNVETARSDKKSVNDQLSGAFTQNINVKADDAYDKTTFNAINKETSAQGAKDKTYVVGAKTLNTYMVTDLGFKSGDIPLTVARYDDRIDKPIVEDPTNPSAEVKEEIAKKLAKINGVTTDKITFDADGNAVIHFDGVDENDAPKIALKDLVLKKLEENQISVPANDKATVVYNPLGYSNAELERIKQSILDANKNNKDLDLTSTDQITLSYLTGDTTGAGKANQGISNGQAENKITVKIKTDKAYAEFTSDVKQNKLTRLVDIRKDYDVSWDNTKNKLDGRDSDEGLSWSNDSHTTIIYRYDPTAAKELKTDDIIKLLKATPKDQQAGLRELQGGENLDHEGSNGKPRKSHMHYALKGDEPTGDLSLGNMSGPYWIGNQKVSHSDEKLGDNLSEAGSYSWDPEAGSVKVAGKKGKIYKARLFVQPYEMTYYKDVYLEQGRNPGNTAKAINVIFVPQTNHKTSDLKKSVDGHTTVPVEGKEVPTQPAYYNASDKKKEAYDKALQTAKTLYDSVKDTDESKLTEEQKAQIDNATINLNKARAELDGPDTNKDGLNTSIEANGKAAQGTTAATGTQATNQFKNVSDPDFKTADGKTDEARNKAAREAKKAYDKALEDAKTLKEDKNATQKAVDDAKAKLDEARKKLNEFTTNKDGLSAAIATDGKVNTGDVDKQGEAKLKTADPTYQNSTTEQREAYDNAVKKAGEVAANPNTSQKEVNKAIDDLKKAKAVLDANATNKAPLDAAVKKSFDNPDPNDANKQSVFYKNAKNKTGDAAAQQAVKNYDDALAEAKRVLGDENATKADVDKAKKALEDAENALHGDKYTTDNTALGKALADNFSGYLMPAYFNAFDKAQAGDEQAKKDFKAYNDAYHAAKDLMDKLKQPGSTITQKEADDIKDKLLEARKVIDKYATDTSKISAALLNSLAIKNSPAYKNASAGAEGSDAKKAQEAYEKALQKLHDAFDNKLPKDKQGNTEISESVIPDQNIDMTNKDALKNLQAHAKGQPLNRDVTKLLADFNKAVADLNKFATKTDELIKSINEDDATHQNPAFKNVSQPNFQKADGSGADDDKNGKAKKAYDEYGDALNAAKDLLKNPAATQKDVDAALKTLNEKRAALDAYNTDTTKLKKSVDEHGKEKQGDVAATEGTVTSDAYRNASDPHFMKADPNDATKLVEDTQKNDDAKKAKADYDKALAKAQELLNKHDSADTPQDAKPTQAEINAALKALDEARTKLDDYKTNAEALKDEAAKSTAEGAAATGTDFENTTEFKNADAKKDGTNDNEDVKAYKEALKKARDLVKAATSTDPSTKNSERPTQEQINDALDALKAAKKQITDNYKTDAAALKGVKEFAAGDFKKTPEYKNAVALKDDQNADAEKKSKAKTAVEALDESTNDSALKKAIDILQAFDDNGKPKQEGPTGGRIPTQKEVDDALETLQKAMGKVTNGYKTNADKLKNEVGDKDQDGKPVIPAFEASVPYKNALAKADAEEDKTSDTSATKKLEAYNEKLKAAQDLIAQVNSTDPNADPDKKPTQAQVDKALSELKAAKDAITNGFKTNVDKLQNEVEDKNEDGTARTSKFEESTEFANLKAKQDGNKKPDDLVAYEKALAKAKELIDKNDGMVADPNDSTKQIAVPKDQLPTQQEVDAAQKALKEIKDKILANYKTNSHDLQEEVNLSKDGDDDTSADVFENTPEFKNADAKKSEDGKGNADVTAYKKALEAAKTLLAKFDPATGLPKTDLTGKAPTQKDLDDALNALKAAKQKITDSYKTNKSDLNTEAGKDSDFTKSPEYQNAQAKGDDASKQALEDYKNALDEANSVLADPNATQAEVDAALQRLKDAKSKLTDSNKTDKSGLQSEADADAKFRKSVYFIIGNRDDIDAYNKALAEANSVLNDPNATQAQVDEALRKLQAAKYKINHPFGVGSGVGSGSGYDTDADAGDGFDTSDSQSASVDKSALQLEVNNSEADSSAASKANTAAARAYVSALAEAKRVLADKNATQAQVDEALRKLQAAKAAWRNASGASGNASGLAKTGAATGLFASLAAVFSGLGAAGVASRRRKHSNE